MYDWNNKKKGNIAIIREGEIKEILNSLPQI
jgi:hypothetical protein